MDDPGMRGAQVRPESRVGYGAGKESLADKLEAKQEKLAETAHAMTSAAQDNKLDRALLAGTSFTVPKDEKKQIPKKSLSARKKVDKKADADKPEKAAKKEEPKGIGGVKERERRRQKYKEMHNKMSKLWTGLAREGGLRPGDLKRLEAYYTTHLTKGPLLQKYLQEQMLFGTTTKEGKEAYGDDDLESEEGLEDNQYLKRFQACSYVLHFSKLERKLGDGGKASPKDQKAMKQANQWLSSVANRYQKLISEGMLNKNEAINLAMSAEFETEEAEGIARGKAGEVQDACGDHKDSYTCFQKVADLLTSDCETLEEAMSRIEQLNKILGEKFRASVEPGVQQHILKAPPPSGG
ncbi:hypothetical protein SCG7109_AG_00100 [Chlamydiales bacterium SCGC AG-110-M15]|nr:hypothetical protein SCG7109_AG_00100 [Chlamydiales bacterium SCGC AG-110-M15]